MYSNKCISYRVDPRLLAEGVPVEQLEKSDVREVPFQEISSAWRSSRSTSKAFSTPKPETDKKPRKSQAGRNTRKLTGMIPESEGQKIQQMQEIKVDNKKYRAILLGRPASIRIKNADQYAGKTLRIVDEKSGSYCFRTLCLSNRSQGILSVL